VARLNIQTCCPIETPDMKITVHYIKKLGKKLLIAAAAMVLLFFLLSLDISTAGPGGVFNDCDGRQRRSDPCLPRAGQQWRMKTELEEISPLLRRKRFFRKKTGIFTIIPALTRCRWQGIYKNVFSRQAHIGRVYVLFFGSGAAPWHEYGRRARCALRENTFFINACPSTAG